MVLKRMIVVGLIMGMLPVATYANGFSVNIQSASGFGTGEAGRAAAVIDSTVIYANPAGLVRLDRPQFTLGFGAVRASIDISNASSVSTWGGAVIGTARGDSVPDVYVPFTFAAYPVNDRLAFGIGVYAPFGLINDYEPLFLGRYHGVYSKVAVVTVQPTISFKINDRLSIGFGPTINRITGRLKNNIDMRLLGGGDALIDVKGSDSGAMGFNLGFMFDLTEQTTLGVTYHSRVNYKLSGRTRFSGLSGAMYALNGRYDAALDITLPESVDVAVTHQLGDKFTLYGGATWTRWSQLRTIDIRNAIPVAPFNHLQERFNWRNTWAYALGASYQIHPQVVLRGGFTLDLSPTSDQTRNVRIPVADRRIIALGVGWTPTSDWTFDFAYTYIFERTAMVNQPAKSARVPSFYARYRNTAHGIAFQLTRRF